MQKKFFSIIILIFISMVCIFLTTNNGILQKKESNSYKSIAFDDSTKESSHENETQNSFQDNVLTLDKLIEVVGMNNSSENKNYMNSPNNIAVAVLDSGIYPHKDLVYPENRIIASYDLVNGIEEPYDDNGHGTALAGIIGGNGIQSDGQYAGIAPFVNLVSVKVLDYKSLGYRKDLIRGIEWVIENKDKYNIRIINISTGVPVEEEDKVAFAAKRAYEAGILVVTSARNGNGETVLYSPAVETSAVTVGLVGTNIVENQIEYSIVKYSQQWLQEDGSTKPDIYAPGSNILTLRSDIYYKGRGEMKNEELLYTQLSGTSISAAVVTGAAAVLMHDYPEKSIDEIKEELLKSCNHIYDEDLKKDVPVIYLGGK